MRCDVIALGIISASRELGLRTPIVVRLQGTNVSQANQVLDNSGLPFITANDLDDAASKAVNVVEIVELADRSNLGVSFELPL